MDCSVIFFGIFIQAIFIRQGKSTMCYICSQTRDPITEDGDCSSQFQYDCTPSTLQLPPHSKILCHTTRRKIGPGKYAVAKECIAEKDFHQFYPTAQSTCFDPMEGAPITSQGALGDTVVCVCSNNFCNQGSLAQQMQTLNQSIDFMKKEFRPALVNFNAEAPPVSAFQVNANVNLANGGVRREHVSVIPHPQYNEPIEIEPQLSLSATFEQGDQGPSMSRLPVSQPVRNYQDVAMAPRDPYQRNQAIMPPGDLPDPLSDSLRPLAIQEPNDRTPMFPESIQPSNSIATEHRGWNGRPSLPRTRTHQFTTSTSSKYFVNTESMMADSELEHDPNNFGLPDGFMSIDSIDEVDLFNPAAIADFKEESLPEPITRLQHLQPFRANDLSPVVSQYSESAMSHESMFPSTDYGLSMNEQPASFDGHPQTFYQPDATIATSLVDNDSRMGLQCDICGDGELADNEDCRDPNSVNCSTQYPIGIKLYCFTRDTILLSSGKHAIEKQCISEEALISEYGDNVTEGCFNTWQGRIKFCTCSTSHCNRPSISEQLSTNPPKDVGPTKALQGSNACYTCSETDLQGPTDCTNQYISDCNQMYEADTITYCLSRRTRLTSGLFSVEKRCVSRDDHERQYPGMEVVHSGCGSAWNGYVQYCVCTGDSCNEATLTKQQEMNGFVAPTTPVPAKVESPINYEQPMVDPDYVYHPPQGPPAPAPPAYDEAVEEETEFHVNNVNPNMQPVNSPQSVPNRPRNMYPVDQPDSRAPSIDMHGNHVNPMDNPVSTKKSDNHLPENGQLEQNQVDSGGASPLILCFVLPVAVFMTTDFGRLL